MARSSSLALLACARERERGCVRPGEGRQGAQLETEPDWTFCCRAQKGPGILQRPIAQARSQPWWLCI